MGELLGEDALVTARRNRGRAAPSRVVEDASHLDERQTLHLEQIVDRAAGAQLGGDEGHGIVPGGLGGTEPMPGVDEAFAPTHRDGDAVGLKLHLAESARSARRARRKTTSRTERRARRSGHPGHSHGYRA